jgi:hypothetical protein
MVFWRERFWKEEVDVVEARDGVCSITDIAVERRGKSQNRRRYHACPMNETTAIWD